VVRFPSSRIGGRGEIPLQQGGWVGRRGEIPLQQGGWVGGRGEIPLQQGGWVGGTWTGRAQGGRHRLEGGKFRPESDAG
jgi:hypothetical protein